MNDVSLHGDGVKECSTPKCATEPAWVGCNHGLQRLADLAPIMLVHCDSERRYLYANRAYTERFRLSLSTIRGKSMEEVCGAQTYSRIRSKIDAVLSGDRVDFEIEMPYPDLGVRTIHAVFEPDRDEIGCVKGFVAVLEDVTARNAAEEALKRSEMHYRLIAEALPYMVWTMRPDLKLDYLNDKSMNYTGLSLEEVNRVGWSELVHPDDLPGMLSTVSGPLAAGLPHTVSYRFRRCDGEYRWVESSAHPLKNADGAVLLWFGSTQDVHDRRMHEQELSESESRFRQLADAMPQIVWMTNADGNVDFHNARWFEYTGLPSPPSPGDGEGVIHPDDRDKVLAAWSEALRTGRWFEHEIRIRDVRTGAYRWFLSRAVPVSDEVGRVIRWFGTSTDIHDQKEIEQRLLASERMYRALGDSLDYGVWVSDTKGTNSYVSQSFLDIVGLTTEQCSRFGWMAPAEASRAQIAWDDCIRRGDRWDFEYRIDGIDGRHHDILARGVPVHDEAGNVSCWVGINIDVTRLKTAETSLRDLNATLEQQIIERSAAAEQRARDLAVSEEELRRQTLVTQSILNSMGEALIVADKQGRIVQCNRAAESLFEVTPGYTISATTSEDYRMFHVDGKTPFPVDELPLVRAIRGESCDEVEVLIRPTRRQGDMVISVTGRPMYGEGGRLEGGVIVMRDMTSRKQTLELLRESEERFRKSFEFSAIGKALVAIDGRWLRVNRSLCDLLGYSESELLAKDFQSITHPDDLAEDLNYAQQLIRGEIRTYQMEKRYIHKEGGTIHILLSGSLVRDGFGNPLYFIAQVHDLTQLKRAEGERRQAAVRTRFVEQTILAREEEQRRIARDLHDGIGQSLTSLRLGLRSLENAVDISKARSSAGELRRIVVSALEEVRTLTKSLRPAVLDDLGLIPAIARLIEDVIMTNHLAVRLQTDTVDGVRFADVIETAVFRIVQEALTNVIRHSEASAVEIILRREAHDLLLEVVDNGIGFDSASSGGGNRFGIAGMRERALLLEGTFNLTSTKLHGTKIRISIPFDRAATLVPPDCVP